MILELLFIIYITFTSLTRASITNNLASDDEISEVNSFPVFDQLQMKRKSGQTPNIIHHIEYLPKVADFPEFESRSSEDQSNVESRIAEKLEYLEKVANFPAIDKGVLKTSGKGTRVIFSYPQL